MAYNRILLKISGEALGGDQKIGLDQGKIEQVVKQLHALCEKKIQIAIVVGGGNFWRGRQGESMDRTTADHMGMLATIINSLALQDACERHGMQTRVQTALSIPSVAEPYILRKALRHLEKGRIVIFACGTGNPYFSTDTGAALRACEIGADAILMAKNIDGVYTSDPKINPDAHKIDKISYMEIVNRGLALMDMTSLTLCKENNIPIVAFGLNEENSILKAANGDKIGTLIS